MRPFIRQKYHSPPVPRHQWSGIAAAPEKHSVGYWLMAGSGSVNAGADATHTAQLGGKDFFGYFLSHKKVTYNKGQPGYAGAYDQKIGCGYNNNL